MSDVAPSEIAHAKRGQIIRVWPLEGGATPGAKSYRILYGSSAPNDEPIGVTAAIVFPDRPAPPGGRPVVAWAHPTTGVATKCAPSLFPDNEGSIAGLAAMMERNYVVVATDYPGLGTPGMHPYLIGDSEARAVLDAVRAARELPDTKALDRFAVWGHSQGGHAALFTGQRALSYAPDLKLVGVAAAAPATYLARLFEADRATDSGLTAMAIKSWSTIFKLPIAGLVEPQAISAYERAADDCIENVSEMVQESDDAAPLERGFLKVDPTTLPEWRSIMDRNTPGQEPAGAPVFLAQGMADTTVLPSVTARYMDHLCQGGTAVRFVGKEDVTHVYIALDSAREAVAWMAERFDGREAPNDCRR
jgi:acetyl esterase/lipase